MIDALLNFPSSQAARNDPVLSRHMTQLQSWVGSYVLPGVQVWRSSQDTQTGTDVDGNPIIVHTYLSGWSLIISLPDVAVSLQDHVNLRVMIDRNKANARQSGMIIKANVTQAVMQDTRFSPVFAGADYPWGNWI